MSKKEEKKVLEKAMLMRKVDSEVIAEETPEKEMPGRKLAAMRRLCGKISRVRLAEMTGTNESTIKKYESERVVRSSTFAKISDFFGVPVEYFLDSSVITDTERWLVQNLQFYAFLIQSGLEKPRGDLPVFFAAAGCQRENSIRDIRNAVAVAAMEAVATLPEDDPTLLYVCRTLGIESEGISRKNIQIRLYEFSGQIMWDSNLRLDQGFSIDACMAIVAFAVCTARSMTRQQYMRSISILVPLISSYQKYLES